MSFNSNPSSLTLQEKKKIWFSFDFLNKLPLNIKKKSQSLKLFLKQAPSRASDRNTPDVYRLSFLKRVPKTTIKLKNRSSIYSLKCLPKIIWACEKY